MRNAQRIGLALVLWALAGVPVQADIIGDVDHPIELTGTKVHLKAGDLVTVLIDESVGANSTTNAEDSYQTTLTSTNGGGFLGPLPTVNNSGGSDHKVQNGMQQIQTMSTTMTAHVTGFDAAGNVILDGNRLLVNNGRKVTMSMHGLARLKDIAPDGSIDSARLADANFKIDGLVRRKPLDYIRHFFGIDI